MDLDILEREVPITEDNPEKSKRGLYKIKDNFILFWFEFVYPNLSFIESGYKALAMKKTKSSLTDVHISSVYEDICIDQIWNLNVEKSAILLLIKLVNGGLMIHKFVLLCE